MITNLISNLVTELFKTLADFDWLVCSHCLTLVKAQVYDQHFFSNLSLIWLPLAILAIVILIIHKH